MKPGDHPDFYRFPAPAGRSRESTIVLDAKGGFHHDGEPVEHRGLARALASWIDRHPDDGRYILTNQYDWCYFTVEATPYFVTGVRTSARPVTIDLFDGTTELLDPKGLSIDAEGVLRLRVKDSAHEARFTRSAQLAMEPLLSDDGLAIMIDGQRHDIAPPSDDQSLRSGR
jgi:uncharacterized protein